MKTFLLFSFLCMTSFSMGSKKKAEPMKPKECPPKAEVCIQIYAPTVCTQKTSADSVIEAKGASPCDAKYQLKKMACENETALVGEPNCQSSS